MSYDMSFKGHFEYIDPSLVGAALEEFHNFDQKSILQYAELKQKENRLEIDFEVSAAASLYDIALVHLEELARYAYKGEVKCSFEGDGNPHVISHNNYTDTDNLPEIDYSWELKRAVEEGDLSQVKELVKLGADLDVTFPLSINLLHKAADKGYAEMVRYLIEEGIDPNQQSLYRKTPLHLAKTVEVAEVLIEKGAKTDLRCSYKMTPFPSAIARGREKVAWYLMKLGLHIDEEGWEIRRALCYLCREGMPQLAREFLEQVENVEEEVIQRGLLMAAEHGQKEMAKIMLERGAEITEEVLGKAGEGGNVELLEELLDLKEDSQAFLRTGDYHNPMVTAAEKGQVGILKMLVERGAPVDPEERVLDTPLIKAAVFGQNEVIEWLLEEGADPDLAIRDGRTALNAAAHNELPETFLLLWEAGARQDDFMGFDPKNFPSKEDMKWWLVDKNRR